MVGPIAMLYNIGQVMISKREDKTKSWHSLKHKLVGDSLGLAEKPRSHQRWSILHHKPPAPLQVSVPRSKMAEIAQKKTLIGFL